MPHVDPRLVTIMISCVILSSLLVVTLIVPKAEEALVLLGNEFPGAILKEAAARGLEARFALALMASRDFDRVEIRVSALYQKPFEGNISAAPSLEDLPSVIRFRDHVQALGARPTEIRTNAEINGTVYDAIIMDFSMCLEPFTDASMRSTLPLVFVLLTRPGEAIFFEGSPCFFMDPLTTLEYVEIRRSEDSREYHRSGKLLKPGLDMSGIPMDGVLVFEGVREDERFGVSFLVDIPADGLPQIVSWRPDVYMMELIQAYADGGLELVLVNIAPRGVRG